MTSLRNETENTLSHNNTMKGKYQVSLVYSEFNSLLLMIKMIHGERLGVSDHEICSPIFKYTI